LQPGFDIPGSVANFPPVNPPGRTFYVTIGGCIAAMILGCLINDENIAIAGGVLLLGLGLALYRVLWRGILLEAVVLGCLLFGYIVGESGFGHLNLGASSPIYFGEVGLVGCFLIFCMRVAFTKERIISRDPLSLAVCAFMVVGALRYLVDFVNLRGNTRDLLTITRDFATIYYVSFFFITANVFKHERSRRFLERVLPVALVFLIPLATANLIYPEIWERLSFHGDQALIYLRSDLAGSFLGFGAIYFMLSVEGRGHRILRALAGLLCFVFVMTMNSRATILAFGLATVILLVARKFRILRDFVFFAIFGVFALAAFHAVRPKQDDEISTSELRDKFLSMIDVGAAGNYETDYGSGKAGNNHFRTEWWKSVYNETMEQNPVFGLGFGYDLAARFIRTYDLPLVAEDFSARSPHCILFTIFGRLGFVGLASFLWVIFLIFRGALRCAAGVRRKEVPGIDLAAWCGVIIIFVAACLSVMLEGPMAAIVFWSLLGMASYRQQSAPKASQEIQSQKAFQIPRPTRPPLAPAGYR
jgi:hypothetical protein